ncbi:hypothetical protein [Nonomuraea jabiensis]|uniref:Uncharacterized protein n=1 Tax=Nonomuraea jabiensis TaxID=882448 RepID=A0A7W9L985_9ACTN|nr:hypothetical protein [Nonomuraea jabiensis]MBB5775334.1 hypothetical protein [Nonomuraea jabiensis]
MNAQPVISRGRSNRLPEIEWKPSPGSMTCEKGWVGSGLLFSIVDYHHKLVLYPRLFGRDGIAMKSETFEVAQSMERTRAKAHARAEEMLSDFLSDVLAPRARQKHAS